MKFFIGLTRKISFMTLLVAAVTPALLVHNRVDVQKRRALSLVVAEALAQSDPQKRCIATGLSGGRKSESCMDNSRHGLVKNVDADVGEIILDFGESLGTIKLLPMVKIGDGWLPFANLAARKQDLGKMDIRWLCLSSYTELHLKKISIEKGTLRQGLPPMECRFPVYERNDVLRIGFWT